MKKKIKKTSEKSFGILFCIVFFIIAFWPILDGNLIRLWAIFPAFIFLFLAFIKPELLNPLNLLWIKLGDQLGKIVAPIIMLLIYFFILTPISLILKVLKKDLINLKFSPKNSYWIKREKNVTSMDKQF